MPFCQRQLKAGVALQSATDEYIEQNEERFIEAAALLLRGRDDLSADAATTLTSLSLGKSGTLLQSCCAPCCLRFGVLSGAYTDQC